MPKSNPALSVRTNVFGGSPDAKVTQHEGAAHRIVHSFVSEESGFSKLYPDDLMDRITIVRLRLPADAIGAMAREMHVPKGFVYEMLGVTRATAARQVRVHKKLSLEATERAVFVAGLVKLIEGMIPDGAEVGDFDAPSWVARWLALPQPALGGNPPRSFLDTADGREIVHGLLTKVGSGAYA